ncbi:aminofutalosine deaminase family hydrolase [Hydrogenimonas sp.]
MKIISAPWIFDGERVLADRAVAFEKRIVAVGDPNELKGRYPDADLIEPEGATVLLPGLINTHVHLEFGANTTHLRYGDFMAWLQSVITRRDELVEACKAECYRRQIRQMLASGITAFGAVSSYGNDMTACRAAPQRVVYFNEAIGSQPAAVDALYADFMQRLEESEKYASDTFVPAVAIHSPYSVHPILIKKILSHIGDRPLSAHFMESPAEKAWLERGEGPFRPFFENFLQQRSPLCFPEEFLQLLEGRRALLTHAVQADERMLQTIAEAGHTITHCPRSNRLLGCGRLKLELLNEKGVAWVLGTDGLSSNTSLDLWEEMRAALMLHFQAPLEETATELLRAATSRAADAMNLPAGRIQAGSFADLILVRLPQSVEDSAALPLQLILHTRRVEQLFIEGISHV